MNIQALPYVILTGFSFGSSLIAARFAIDQFSPITYVNLRLLLASICFVAIYILDNRRHPWPVSRRLWRHGLVLGVVSTAVPMLAFVMALQYLSSGVTSVLNTSGPALTIILAHFFLPDETLTQRKSIGVALAFAGAILLALRGESGLAAVEQANPLGYILVLIGLTSVSGSTIYARKFARDLSSFDITSSQIFIGTAVLLPITLMQGGFDVSQVNGQGYFVLVYGALIGTVLAFLLFFHLISRFGATATAMVPYIVPVVATLGGLLLLDETLTWVTVAGMLIIGLGIAILNSQGRKPRIKGFLWRQ
jgi:drug/metabolite transporter (DMT)-like permease